ncbi:lysozyme inhibitor LprI family protein [Oceanobacillus halophilus]|uniref:DUF1311 domain-containing protein n=1 Tax=Oceanobacillus halophilus TaxID=930130 RepID=A0A494ZXN8_9BACI|nr:lysozyme inhibitor LprI family protein [Oceanobacillus halophilus]RKQ31528.1 DUF1311 domain-containing protein [Oceanobacillus halophilus]
MKKCKLFMTAILLVLLIVGLSACGNSTNNGGASSNHSSEPEHETQETDATEDTSTINESSKVESDGTGSNTSTNEQSVHTEEKVSTATTNETEESEDIKEPITENTGTKVEGIRQEFLKKLDKIQEELDALPEKKDSDKGVTNAMKNYYGLSYERYDEALNEIYAVLQGELSSETMQDLKTKQIKWIHQKEAKADEARQGYKGGTFENVAYYISLYESTKERSYELVNEFMTD